MTDSTGTFAERWPRRSRMVGGPLDGQTVILPLPERFPEPPTRCCKTGGGLWHHYVRSGPGVYAYVAPCCEVDHDGPEPSDWDRCCCCGKDD